MADRQPQGHFHRNRLRIVIDIDREDYKGTDLVNIRVWYRADNGEMRPSKTGITINGGQIDQLIEALQAVKAEGRATNEH